MPGKLHCRLEACIGALLFVAGVGLDGSGAGAETLKQALGATYKFDPRLDAAHAIQRTDEEVPREPRTAPCENYQLAGEVKLWLFTKQPHRRIAARCGQHCSTMR